MNRTLSLLPLVALALLSAPAVEAQDSATIASANPSRGFDDLSGQAAAAREANRLDEAMDLYAQALELRPDWDEGWWYLGTLHYEARRHAQAVEAFERFVALKPEISAGWALLGINERELPDYASAVEHIQKALNLGLGGPLKEEAWYQLSLALIKREQFELAVEPLTLLARTSPETRPGLVATVGLLLLRRPLLPSEVAEEHRDLVTAAGRAGYLDFASRAQEAGPAYEALLEGWPDEPWVHYAQGTFLLRNGDKGGLAALRRELEVKPDNVMACLEITFELILRGEYEEARPLAEKGVELAPQLFATRNALGRVLVELGEVEEGIRQLEEAVRLAPESPEMHFALGRAYARAGRTEEAARARAAFAQLEEQRRESQPGGSSPSVPGQEP
jgi:tetratricopeptide (TPR) repeat protein